MSCADTADPVCDKSWQTWVGGLGLPAFQRDLQQATALPFLGRAVPLHHGARPWPSMFHSLGHCGSHRNER